MRGSSLTAQTHCGKVHELSGRNVREHTLNGQLRRICLLCKREYAAARAKEIKGAKLQTSLDAAARRRLLSASCDGVGAADLCDRFGLGTHETLMKQLAKARQEAQKEKSQ